MNEQALHMNTNNTRILACGSLMKYVEAAQDVMKTSFPVVEIDRAFHSEPGQMKEKVAEAIKSLQKEIDTVLVAMGFCGGAWDHAAFDRQIVIPRVDDCVSLLLHRDDAYHPNLKETGHLYLYDDDPEAMSVQTLLRGGEQRDEYGGMDEEALFHYWFDNYHYLDIIDTGLNPCYEEAYVEKAQESADMINAELGYVEGSNRLLEKLVSGQWDEQFLVVPKERTIMHGDFFE